MRRFGLIAMAILLCAPAAEARMRLPSCEALVAFVMTSRSDPVEISFGKKVDAMSADEFDQAIDVVEVCADEVLARPPDVPGLFMRERKPMQLAALSILSEDLRFYRNRQREREMRAARRTD